MDKVKYIMPLSAVDFSCIGPECTYNCCDSEWSIFVDKKTFLKYKALPSADPMASIISRSIKRKRDSKSDYSYAYIKHDKRCPFLNEDNLCDMQLTHGADYLCRTCHIYPRIEYKLDGRYHRGFSLTCEEVIRRCVMNKNGIDFVKVEVDKPKYPIANIEVVADDYHNPRRYFFEIREFIFALLKFRKYSFSERMIILGMFMKALDTCEYDKVPSLIEKYLTLIGRGGFDNIVKDVVAVPQIPVTFIDAIVAGKRIKMDDATRERIFNLEQHINELRQGNDDYNWYTDLLDKSEPYLKEYEYVFENFVIMSIFNSYEEFLNLHIPFIEAFGKFAMYYMVLRTFFMMQILDNKLSEFDIIKMCIDIAHVFDVKQCGALSKNAMKNIKEMGSNVLGLYIALIK